MRSLAIAAAALCACGGGDDHPAIDAPEMLFDAPASFGQRMPRVFAADPTDIMTAPKGMAITYDGDPNRVDIEKFFAAYGASPAWAAQTAEYGVGPLTAATPQHIGSAAPATVMESDLLALLTTNLTGATPAWGAPDKNTIYMFFLPNGTVLDDGTGSLSCDDYDGYHYDTTIGGVQVAYAFSALCHKEATQLGITDLQDLTITAGHETLEAATDPRTSQGAPFGWGEVDDAHAAWEYITEGEIADLCEFASTEDWLAPPSLPYAIQRTWSNAAAAAGHDPCVGDAATTYYQTIPDDPDVGVVNYEDKDQHTAGTKIAVGATGSITLQVYTDTPGAGPFKVALVDENESFGGDRLLQITQPTGMFMPGDRITVQAKVLATDPGVDGGEAYEVDTTPVAGGPTTIYYAFVLQ